MSLRCGRDVTVAPRKGRLDRFWGRHICWLWIASPSALLWRRCNRGEVSWFCPTRSIIVIVFVGLVAGWLAGKIVRGTGFGIIGDILVGIAGALISSLLFPRLGIHLGTGIVSEIIYSAIGAIILLLVVRLLRGW